jgi:hypothetical protein
MTYNSRLEPNLRNRSHGSLGLAAYRIALTPKMLRHFSIVFLSLHMVYCSSALADDNTDKQIIESGKLETLFRVNCSVTMTSSIWRS